MGAFGPPLIPASRLFLAPRIRGVKSTKLWHKKTTVNPCHNRQKKISKTPEGMQSRSLRASVYGELSASIGRVTHAHAKTYLSTASRFM